MSIRFIATLCVCFLFAYTGPAFSQVKIAVVNVEKVLNEAKAAKALNKKRTQAREAFLTKLSKEEKALREEGKALFEKRKDLSEEEFSTKQRAYQSKVNDMGKKTQQNRRLFEQVSNKALDKLKDELALTVQQIANDEGFGLVISNRNVIAAEPDFDITDKTIKALNNKKISVPFEFKNK
ncbi:MAG: OmpH family outer membrane protein [Bdellovibrionales bacterium]